MGVSLLHNMLARELAVVGLLVIVLVVYYFRYVAAARMKYERTREHRRARVLHSTRRQLVVVAILLVGVFTYDRVLPHFGFGATAALEASSSHKPTKTTASKKTPSKKFSAKKIPVDQKQAASASSKAAQEAVASRDQSAASEAAIKASESKAAAAQAASSQAQQVDPKQKAIASTQQYLADHPNAALGRIDSVDVIDYSTDYNGIPAYQVGLYQTQVDGSNVAVHMCFVYANGEVAQAY